ncbi:MAG: phosphotransferase family protein [Reyranella sp.]|uniref:choline/ethanolamine kinase family protein n=1 Tax=Reyranella sp. TaxID=1929291 RepID=UPI001AC870E7|nr:choline/ethanolamine kinase family protein [Reyranella sp.]MBN9089071.1 phosphotransferase family protein [Reyranella sp.]
MADDALLDRIARLSCWRGRVSLAPLEGGLTNLSFVAEDRGEKFVVRCGGDIPVHHVFRDRERAASRAAFEAGLSPEVVHVEPAITVLRFIDGRTFDEADMRENLDRLVPLLKTCHREVGRKLQGPSNMFWVFHVIRDYVRSANADAKYLALADALEHRQVPLPIVFGHHDLLPGNFMDDGKRLWLIDWEYGAFGTPMFDLANLSSNGEFDAAQDERLLAAYFGASVDPGLKDAFAAMKAASALREALWAMVSDIHLKTPGIDYQAHAREYLRRFEKLLSS